MPVIAMTREMGSRGKDIAIGLAERLGVEIVHHNLVEHDLADRLHAEESDVHRYLEGKTKRLERWSLKQRKISTLTAGEVLELAERGNILIRGWGSPHLLRPVSHVVCLRVCAPMSERVNTVMARMELTDADAARREIDINDAAHERVLRRMVHADWRDPLLYDLVINTDRIPVPDGVALVEELVRRPSFQETAASRAKLRQLRVETQVRNALAYDRELGSEARTINVSVDPEPLTVTLSGAVLRRRVRDRAIEAVEALGEIGSIRDEIKIVRD